MANDISDIKTTCLKETNIKLEALDFWRVIGALMVFMCHFDSSLSRLGNIAVEFFFVLSGFSLTIGYYHKNISFKQYMWRRIKRIYPLYLLVLLLCFVELSIKIGFPSAIIRLPGHLFLLQVFVPHTSYVLGFAGASWYVATLFYCYIVFYVIRRLRLGGVLSIIICHILLIYTLFDYMGKNGLIEWFYWFSPFARIVDFNLGICFGMIAISAQTFQFRLSDNLLLLLEILSFFIIVLYLLIDDKFTNHIFVLGIFIGFFILFSSLSGGLVTLLIPVKIISSLSNLSFSFYLCHRPILRNIEDILICGEMGYVERLLISLLICLVVSIVFYYINDAFARKYFS